MFLQGCQGETCWKAQVRVQLQQQTNNMSKLHTSATCSPSQSHTWHRLNTLCREPATHSKSSSKGRGPSQIFCFILLSFLWSEHATIRQLRTRIASTKWVFCGHELLANHLLSRQQGNNQALETDVQASTLQASVVNGHTGRPKVCRPSTIHRHWRKDFRREVSPGHGRGLKRAVATAQAEDSLRAPRCPIPRSEKLLFRGKTKVHELHCSASCFHDVVDLTPHHESRYYGFLVRVCTAAGLNVSVDNSAWMHELNCL